MDEAEARGESKGDAAAVEGDDSDSAVLAVMVRFIAGWPLAETAVEDMIGRRGRSVLVLSSTLCVCF